MLREKISHLRHKEKGRIIIQKNFALSLVFALLAAPSAFGMQQSKRGLLNTSKVAAKSIVQGETGKRMDEYLKRLTGFGYSGVLLVVKDGKIILRKAYGLANKEQSVSNMVDTVFDIASLSKQFTAAAILKLEMEGKLKVGDPISKYLSNVPSDKASITIHQLLSHSSGLPGGVVGPAEIGRDQVTERIFKRPLSSAPGTQFRYSNSGYTLLAAIVELVSGEPFREYVKKKIFGPAKMSHTGFEGELTPRVSTSLIAHGYDDFNRGGSPRDRSGTSWRNVGQSGVTSTVGDLYKWHLALLGDAILSREAKEKMWTTVLNDYGYGWWIKKTAPNSTEISHAGDGDGFGSYFGWFKDEKVLIISLSNIRHDLYPTHIKADDVITKIIFGQPYDSPPMFSEVSSKLVGRLLGTYQLRSGGKLVVHINRKQLQIGATGQDAIDVLREGDEKDLKERGALTSITKNLLEAYLRGDMTPLAKVGGDDPDFLKSIGDEIREIGKGKGQFQSFDVRGTCPAGEPGVQNTFVQLNYERGSGPYRFRWRGAELDGTYVKSSALAAVTPLQSESTSVFVGWNIMSWEATKGFKLYVNLEKGKITGITIRRDNLEWVARRV